MSRRLVVTLVLSALAASAVLAVPLASGSPAARYTVTALDFRFQGMPKRVVRGTHTFTLINRGQATHDLRIAGKKTRILNPGQRQALKVTFKRKGRFPFVCTVPGHATLGMKGVLVVR